MAIESAQVAVSTVAVSLALGGGNGVRLRLSNPAGPTVYLGPGTAISSTANFALAGTSSLDWYVDHDETLYALTATGTATLHVLRGGV